MSIQLPVVRYACPQDYPQIISMTEALHAENGQMEIDYPTAEAAIMQAINLERSMIGVIGPVGAIQGLIFLRFAEFWFSRNNPFLEEMLSYVSPEYRKGTHNARALLTFARNAADRLNLPLMIGVLSLERTKAKLALYQKHFGEPVGGWFWLYPRQRMMDRGRERKDEAIVDFDIHADA